MNRPASSRAFYFGAFLVMVQASLGFWIYTPSSTVAFYIAVVASIAIPIGFFKKWAWARGAAMLVAIVEIVNALFLSGFHGPAGEGLVAARIALSVFVLVWLKRKSVREHFIGSTPRESTSETA